MPLSSAEHVNDSKEDFETDQRFKKWMQYRYIETEKDRERGERPVHIDYDINVV